MNTPKDLRHSNPYRVPDGYFADLRSTLRERVAEDLAAEGGAAPAPGLWQRIKGVAGLSAAFGCLVLLAVTGFYFTGYKARQREQLAMQEETAEMFLAYHLYSEDLEELDEYAAADPEAQAQDQALFAEAVTEYLDTYGYGGADLSAALTGSETDW